MASRRFRRKYQSGGSVIPSFQGAQVLGQPQRISQDVRPIEFDPNSTFQALNTRQDNLRGAISLANLNRQERQDAWKQEVTNRDYLDKRLTALQKSITSGQDQLTKLDLNVPEQFRMSQVMRRDLDRINAESAAILTDNSITPSERGQRLQEKIVQAQTLFSNPEYVKHSQNNILANKVYDGIAKASSDGKTLIDFNAANNNLELARRFKAGEIDRATFFNGLQNFSLDPKAVDNKEKVIDQYIRDALDPDKAVTNWEKYKGDDDFLIFQEKFTVPDLDSQVDTVFNLYKNDGNWLKVQEARGNRAFLNQEGLVDDAKLKDHVRRKIQLIRGSLGAQGKELTVDVSVKNRPSRRNSGGGSSGPSTAGERRNLLIQQGLQRSGYEVLDPSILSNLGSASEALNLLETPDGEIENPADLSFKRDLERAVRKGQGTPINSSAPPFDVPARTADNRTREEQVTGQAPATTSEWVNFVDFDSSGFPVHSQLVVGDNNGAVPLRIDRDLGLYTNNPLNVKGSDKTVPVIKRFDRNDKEGGPPDKFFHRVFPTMQDGIGEGINMLNRYRNGENKTFVENLSLNNKTIEDATIDDLYRTWATGANDVNIKRIADEMGVTPDTKLTDVKTEDLFMGVLSVENPKIYKLYADNGVGGANNPVQNDVPVEPSNKIVSKIGIFKDTKKELEEANIYGDDLSEQQKMLDSAIKEEEKNLELANDAMSSVDKLGAGKSTTVTIGPGTFIPPTGLGGKGFTSKNQLKIEKARTGGLFRVKMGNQAIAVDLSKAELEAFIQEAAGKTKAEIRNLGQGAIQTETKVESVPAKEAKAPKKNAANKSKGSTGIGYLDGLKVN